MRRIVLILAALPALLGAEIRLPALLSDHMVVQRDQPVHLWGWAQPGERVEAFFRMAAAAATADAEGRWSLYLPPQEAGGAETLRIRDESQAEIEIADVLVGEVWAGSGQSNMVWTVARSRHAADEIAAADFPEIRLFKVKLATAQEMRDDVEGEWVVCSPETVSDFSAVGYFFARSLHKKTGVPFGVIQSAWGGTPAQAWTPRRSLEEDLNLRGFLERWRLVMDAYPRALARYERDLAAWEAAPRGSSGGPGARPQPPTGPDHHHAPAVLYNAMIAPLTPFAIRGVIWYQGENNAHRAESYEYRALFRRMIEDWRSAWGVGPFPFLFVQLANFARVPETSQWPELREAQAMALGLVNTGMAVTIDIGDPDDIHPTNKQDVGERLALGARAVAYGERDLVWSGPVYRYMTRTSGGGSIRLWFDHVGGGLELRGEEPEGFEIAGADGEFVPARARVEGGSVVVSSRRVHQAVAVRYAWAADPKISLFNLEGLPASPFRTDNWR